MILWIFLEKKCPIYGYPAMGVLEKIDLPKNALGRLRGQVNFTKKVLLRFFCWDFDALKFALRHDAFCWYNTVKGAYTLILTFDDEMIHKDSSNISRQSSRCCHFSWSDDHESELLPVHMFLTDIIFNLIRSVESSWEYLMGFWSFFTVLHPLTCKNGGFLSRG